MNDNQENYIFKDFYEIPGYSNYVINKKGEVYSIISHKMLQGSTNPKGYHNFRLLGDDGKVLTWGRHRLLCYVFKPIENSIENLVVNHENGVKGCDELENLSWCTYSQNLHHAGRNGLTTKCIPIQVRNIDTGVVDCFDSIIDCARRYNVSKDTIVYRLTKDQDHIFPERKQYRKFSNNPWPEPKDIKLKIKENGLCKNILLRNIKTGKVLEFEKMTDLSNHLKISPATLTGWINKINQPVLPGYYQIKMLSDKTPWRIVSNPEEELLKNFNCKKPVKVTNVKTNEFKIYDSAVDCSKILNIPLQTLHYRLKFEGKKVFVNNLKFEYYFK